MIVVVEAYIIGIVLWWVFHTIKGIINKED